ncbi:MAG: permease [Elusimicrobia bacterium]|nr:permease [Elusimicrobiota bacterium]
MAKRDPICGMEGKWAAHHEVFCSLYCLKEFESKNNLPAVEPVKIKKWSFQKILTFAVYFFTIVGLFAGFIIPAAKPFTGSLWNYVRMVLPAFGIGILIAGAIDVFIPKEIISRLLGRGDFSDVIKASALGFTASTCSHGCLALSVELYKKGASPAAFLSFLLASPWASLPTTIILVRLFGWRGFLIVGLAFAVSLTTGFGIVILSKKGWISPNPHGAGHSDQPAWELLKINYEKNKNLPVFLANTKNAALSLLQMTFPWVCLGIVLSAAAGVFLPHLIHNYLGRGALGPLASLLTATVVEVCSEGSAPMAFEIYKQTAALGSAFIFLEAGVITDFTEITLVAANAGKKVCLAMVALALPQALLLGYLLNLL